MHQNHDQISGLSVSNLFICGLKAYLVIFGSQLLNLYNNVAVCRFESHVCDSRTPGYDDPGIRLSNSQGDQRGGGNRSFQKPGNPCRTGGRHPAWHEPSCDRRIRRRGRDVRLAAFPQACSVSAAGLASDSIRRFTSTTLSSMQATPTQGIPSADSRCSEFIGNSRGHPGGHPRGHRGDIRGTSRGHRGDIRGTSRGHPGDMQGDSDVRICDSGQRRASLILQRQTWQQWVCRCFHSRPQDT